MFRFMRALSHVAHRLSYDICHVFYMTFVMIHMFDSIDINDNVARRASCTHANTHVHVRVYRIALRIRLRLQREFVQFRECANVVAHACNVRVVIVIRRTHLRTRCVA